MLFRKTTPTAFLAAIGLFMGSVAGGSAVAAESTPDPVIEADAEVAIELRPVHIHAGTCDDLGDVVYPLSDLQSAASVPDPDATPELDLGATPDAAAAIGLTGLAAQSATEVDVSLEDLLAEPHAINVHESAENIQNYIACGDITGTPDGDEIFIDLTELDNSNFVGEAELSDQGDGTTIVHVSLIPSEDTGTPVATPSS